MKANNIRYQFSQGERISDAVHKNFTARVEEYVDREDSSKEIHRLVMTFVDGDVRTATFSGFPSIGNVVQCIAALYYHRAFPCGDAAAKKIVKRSCQGRLTEDQMHRALTQIACDVSDRGTLGQQAKETIEHIDAILDKRIQ